MLESICPTFVIPATLSCIIIRIYDIHMPWFSLPTTTTTFYFNPPLLPPLLVPKGSLARSNASEGYPFEKVKSRCELAGCYAVDSFIVSRCILFFLFCRVYIPARPRATKKDGKEENKRKTQRSEKRPKYHILLLPFKMLLLQGFDGLANGTLIPPSPITLCG